MMECQCQRAGCQDPRTGAELPECSPQWRVQHRFLNGDRHCPAGQAGFDEGATNGQPLKGTRCVKALVATTECLDKVRDNWFPHVLCLALRTRKDDIVTINQHRQNARGKGLAAKDLRNIRWREDHGQHKRNSAVLDHRGHDGERGGSRDRRGKQVGDRGLPGFLDALDQFLDCSRRRPSSLEWQVGGKDDAHRRVEKDNSRVRLVRNCGLSEAIEADQVEVARPQRGCLT